MKKSGLNGIMAVTAFLVLAALGVTEGLQRGTFYHLNGGLLGMMFCLFLILRKQCKIEEAKA